MTRLQATAKIEQLIVTLKALGEPYCTAEDIEALEFAKKNLVNTGTLKGMIIFNETQYKLNNWKDALKATEVAHQLFDRYLDDGC